MVTHRRFDSLLPLVDPSKVDMNSRLSLLLNNNGITNMLAILLEMVKANSNANMLPKALRSIYTYEIGQAVKRSFKHQDHSDLLITQKLNSLLGIDFAQYGTTLQGPYELEPFQPRRLYITRGTTRECTGL